MIRKALLVLAIGVALHGALFGVSILLFSNPGPNDALAMVYLFVVLLPAMLLAAPFSPLLWALHLMNAPGWFAWPKPLGFALVYASWVLVLLAGWYACGRRRSRV